METALFEYSLPPERIAQSPLTQREQAKLLRVTRTDGRWEDKHIYDLPDLLEPGDLLILNDSKVFRARLEAAHESLGTFELFLLRPEGDAWTALIRHSRKLQPGDVLTCPDGTRVTLLNKGEDGIVHLDFHRSIDAVFLLCDTHGSVPTPPYVAATKEATTQYQTIYARERGSVAAPTAGFHFTESLFQNLEARGIKKAFVTLHVGIGTFRPMQSATLAEHVMHEEWAMISPETVALIQATKAAGHRVIAIGTTATRALESAAQTGTLIATSGFTNLFITPGYKFQVIDGLLTNFHLPKSTLLVLVSAFAGRESMLAAYAHAIEKDYRFYSFGDAMLIL